MSLSFFCFAGISVERKKTFHCKSMRESGWLWLMTVGRDHRFCDDSTEALLLKRVFGRSKIVKICVTSFTDNPLTLIYIQRNLLPNTGGGSVMDHCDSKPCWLHWPNAKFCEVQVNLVSLDFIPHFVQSRSKCWFQVLKM